MDKIQPPIKQNYIVRAEMTEPLLADVLSEIGCFGILIRLVRLGFILPAELEVEVDVRSRYIFPMVKCSAA